MKDHNCFIGDRMWHFKKDVLVRVPQHVAEILGHSQIIYPSQFMNL
jgi:hypothetical protein